MLTFNRLLRVVALTGLFLVGMALHHSVRAQTETELRSTADYAYGQTMRFQLRANNLGEIAGVTLYFRPHTAAESYVVEIPIEPGPEVEVSYALDLTQTKLPPFSSVSYWWVLENSDGATLRVPERTISYVDDQFSWQWLSKSDPEGGGAVTVQWTGEDPSLGQTAFDIVLSALGHLSPYMALDEVQPFNVFIYPSTADLGSAMRLAGQDWKPGQTYPELGVLLVTAVNPATAEEELTSGIGRELTDLLLYQALGENAARVPDWLHSGLAELAAGGPDVTATALLADGLANGKTLTFRDLCAALPTTESEVILARAQSGALLQYIIDTYGPQSVVGLITSFAGGDTCEVAFDTVLQTTPDEIEQMWRQQYQPVDSQRVQISQAIIWVTLILLGFGLAALLVWRTDGDRSR